MFEKLNKLLGDCGTKFVVGETLTIADIPLYAQYKEIDLLPGL
jgi:glutathione S-transferase